MKGVIVIAAVVALAAAGSTPPAQAWKAGAAPGVETEYVVLYQKGVSAADARRAVKSAGGTIVKENGAVGVATITTTNADFAGAVRDSGSIEGVAHNRSISDAPDPRRQTEAREAAPEGAVERAGDGAPAGSVRGRPLGMRSGKPSGRPMGMRAGGSPDRPLGKPAPGAEPLSELQWDMKQIHATVAGSYRHEQGDPGVLVGVLDTGVDASHPDIAPNFNHRLSRNFTVDIPVDANGKALDGPCEAEPDHSCNDPADVDERDHGTHVASSIASPINQLGIAGVAPKVSIVSLRVGQDSGLFFLQPTVDALTYAGDVGIDVVNMSYYIDPWLFNCTDNPADSPADRLEQATIIKATQRALTYAHDRGVTLISAAGNGATDYTKELTDASSPDVAGAPGEAPYTRKITPSCVSMPTEGNHVISISSTAISGRKAYYSDYGNGYVDLAAPGGDVFDTEAGTRDVSLATLAAYPKAVAEARGQLNPDGTPKVANVVRDCRGTVCGYYQYLQGTSMASPRAAGVAALIVSRFGRPDRVHGGKTLDPAVVEEHLRNSATRMSCPTASASTYTRKLSDATVTEKQFCEGSGPRNGFYGSGIVDALRAVH
ncbi:S8 family serine peptidase [Streptosporangium subroseum]|uniref:S8 family serine peptidase n=1 Tax=Streptosporangium subroseum TaxID=106412 RepID=UPI00343752AC